jgi:hypothetical protein
MKKNILKVEDFEWGDLPQEYVELYKQENLIDKIYQKYYTIKENDIVVDLGADRGSFTYSILDSLPKEVYCVEPVSKTIEYLTKNVSRDNVKIINKSIGYINDHNTITFQTLVTENKIKKINFLKCDCEGGEYSVFTPSNYEYISNCVYNAAGEWHIVPGEEYGGKTVERFIEFRNLYLKPGKFKIFDRFENDMTNSIFNDQVIYDFNNRYYKTFLGQFIFYMWK